MTSDWTEDCGQTDKNVHRLHEDGGPELCRSSDTEEDLHDEGLLIFVHLLFKVTSFMKGHWFWSYQCVCPLGQSISHLRPRVSRGAAGIPGRSSEVVGEVRLQRRFQLATPPPA